MRSGKNWTPEMGNDLKESLIRKYDLKPHPEGGFYSETYRAGEIISRPTGENRNASTGNNSLRTGECHPNGMDRHMDMDGD